MARTKRQAIVTALEEFIHRRWYGGPYKARRNLRWVHECAMLGA
jgi:hypothetical protein